MINDKRLILIAGGGGFIGGHLAARLLQRRDCQVRVVDIKPMEEWYQHHPQAENMVADLRQRSACDDACQGVHEVYNLACDMGGMGFIENHKALCMISVLINTHLLQAALAAKVQRYFYASSACVYNADRQRKFEVTALKESDAYPAMPEDGYGWEKLFSERMCRHFQEDFGLTTRIARFHNVYGPYGTWEGGREKAPAAICRKVIEAVARDTRNISIWGDGRQTRSFMYIEDCLQGMELIMRGDYSEPINLGSNQLVSINQLVDVVEGIVGVKLSREYQLNAPKGVNGRNSDNTLIRSLYCWEPGVRLEDGMRPTFEWILEEFVVKYGSLCELPIATESLLQRTDHLTPDPALVSSSTEHKSRQQNPTHF